MLEVRDWADQPSWDAFIGSQRSGHYHQSWGWGDVAERLGARVFRRAVVDGDDIRATMTVLSNSIRFAPFRLLYVNRGPVVDEPTEDIFGLIREELGRLAKREAAAVARMEPFVAAGDTLWPSLLYGLGFRPLFPPSQPRSQWMIDLTAEPDELLAAMKPKWRYNVRLAEKRGVGIETGTEKDVDAYYSLYRETAKRDGFYIHSREIYDEIFHIFWKLGQFDLLMARLDGEPIAAVTLVTLGRTSWYAFGASSNSHRDTMAPHALQWEAMKLARQRGAQLYDMRGVADVPSPDQDMAGVYRFKQGFGGFQFTALEQYACDFRRPHAGLWKAYWRGRFTLVSARRRRHGLPHRTWA